MQTKKLDASEALCQKLFNTGLYWQTRSQRKERELLQVLRMQQQLPQATAPTSPVGPNGSPGPQAVLSPRLEEKGANYEAFSLQHLDPKNLYATRPVVPPPSKSTQRIVVPKSIQGKSCLLHSEIILAFLSRSSLHSISFNSISLHSILFITGGRSNPSQKPRAPDDDD